jgi:hypothetical protein
VIRTIVYKTSVAATIVCWATVVDSASLCAALRFSRVVSTVTFPECVKFSRGYGSAVRCMRRLPVIDLRELRRKMDVMVHYTAGDG